MIDGTNYEALRQELVKELVVAPPGSQIRATLLDSLVMVKAEMDKAAEKAVPKPQGRPRRPYFDNLFKLHTAVGDQGSRMSQVRQILKEACIAACEKSPESAEQTLGIRAMHLAMMHFNSSIVLNEPTGAATAG